MGEPLRTFAADSDTNGQCAKCCTAIVITEFTLELGATLSRALVSRGEAPLAIDKLALCAGCEPVWRKEREAHAAKVIAKEERAFEMFKKCVDERGLGKALSLLRTSKTLTQDDIFMRRVNSWISRQEAQARSGKKGPSY